MTAARADGPIERGAAALVAHQEADGAWRSALHAPLRAGPALTAFCADTLLGLPAALRERHAGAWERALGYLAAELTAGEPYERDPYAGEACAYALSALCRANAPARLRERLRDRVCDTQLAEAWGWSAADAPYGGWEAGSPLRAPLRRAPNLSSARAALQALGRAGLPASHPVWARARAFVGRHAAADGGYARDELAFAKAGAREGRPVAYGSATADGVLALRAAGARGDDPGLRAAEAWLVRHPGIRRVPGFDAQHAEPWGRALRLYYAWVRAEALSGADHAAARAEIARELAAEQRGDGSWVGEGAVMMEDEPILATALVLRALAACAD